MTSAYLNFDLLIDRGPKGGAYRARVIQSPAGEAVIDFSLPFTEDELKDFLWRTASGTRHLGAAPDEAGPALDLRGFGARLYGAAFAGPVGLCLRRSLDEAERRGANLRIRLRLDAGALDLAALPWEFLFAPDLDRFLALSDLTPIVRYIELDRPVQPLHARLPLTVVAIIANPSNVPPLAVEGEWQHVQDALSPLIERGAITLERLEAATLPALQARLRRGPVHLLHFVGHGSFDAQSNTGGLVFEQENGRAEMVAAETLGMLLHDHEALRLIFLNACEGAQGGRSDPFAGVAQRLVQQGAPAVLAMQFPVTDAAAIGLSQAFYQALADGLPADTALSQARKAIAARGNDREWATPVLFSRSEDNRLFDLRDALPAPPCPYPGMVPFRAEDSRFFYGREDEIQQMVDHLRHQRLLFVIGPSGSGKSSLIAAGLLPRLDKSSYFGPGFWLVRTMRPLEHPVSTLAACLEGDVSQPEQAVAALLAAHAAAQRLLLVIDQFEETFSLVDKAERQQFMAALQVLRRSQQCALVIALRADFYPDLMNCELWPVDPGQRLEVAVLRGGALRQAIRQPAADVEVEIDEALIERLLADAAGEPGALPMLQETLVLLWDRMRRRQITLGDYEQLGEAERSGLAVAVARKADATVAELTPAEQLISQRIFLRLIQFGEGRRDTRRQLPAADLRSAAEDDQAFERTLEHLARNRLLTTSGEEGRARRVDIAHEALITGWPRLQEWLIQRRVTEQTRRRFESKADEWIAADKRGGLLDEYELLEAEHWLASEDAQELGHSQELADLVSASKDAVIQKKAREAEAERSRRRSRLFAGGLALAMLVIVLVGYFALLAQTERNKAETAATAEAAARAASDANALEANRQKAVAETAQAQAVVAQATAEAAAAGEAVQRARAEAARIALSAADQLAIDKERALLLAIYAAKQDASAFTDSALRRTLASPGHTAWFWPALPARPVWSHSGRELLIKTAENDIVILDTETGTQKVATIDHIGPVERLTWSPDDAYLLVETSAGVQVWSTAVQQPVAVAQAQVASTQVPWSPDGSKVLLGTDQGLSLWDWSNDRIIALETGGWPEIAWSGDGSHLSTFSDGALQIWDASDGAPRSLAPELAQAGGALWSPRDSRLLIIGSDGRLRLWNAADATTIELATAEAPLPTPDPDPIIIVDGTNPDPADWRNHVAWSPDGTQVLTAKDRVQVWNAGDGALVADLWDRPGPSLDAYWSPDSTRVLIDDGQQVRIVSAAGGGQDPVLLGRTTSINTGYRAATQPWSLDGRKILTVAHNKVQVWDANTGAEMAFLTAEAVIDLISVEWSPASNHVLGINYTEQVRVWDLEPAMKPVHPEGYLQSWSPNGAYLITESGRAEQMVARVWNADTGLEIAELEAQGQSKQIDAGNWMFRIDEWSPDGRRLITYSSHNVLRVWNATDWQTYVDLVGHSGQITDAAWSPLAHDLVATASEDGTIRIWKSSTGQTIRVLEGHEGPVNDVEWSPDGTHIASAGTDKTVRIWWADSGEPVQVLRGHSGSVTGVSWNPQVGSPLLLSERELFGDKNDTARVWNILTGEQVAALVFDGSNVHTATWNNKLGTHIAAITDKHKVYLWQQAGWSELPDASGKPIAWSPNGAYLAGARADATVVVWDSRTGSVFKEFVGHTGDVNSIDWSLADAKSFVSHGDDGQLRLWNLDSATATAVIDTADTSSSWVAFSPSGTLIAFMGSNEGLQVYPTSIEDLIATACRAAVRNLGQVDWQEFIGSHESRPTCEDRPVPGIDYPDPRANTGLG